MTPSALSTSINIIKTYHNYIYYPPSSSPLLLYSDPPLVPPAWSNPHSPFFLLFIAFLQIQQLTLFPNPTQCTPFNAYQNKQTTFTSTNVHQHRYLTLSSQPTCNQDLLAAAQEETGVQPLT